MGQPNTFPMNITLIDIATYLPERVLTNEELSSRFSNFDPKKIYDKVGIEGRHVAAPNETALDMAEKACRKLLQTQSLSDVDFLLLCTQSPDYLLPTGACILQERLGLPRSIGALDFNLGCSGFVYGLALAKGLLCGGIASKVLLVTSETYTKHLHPDDRSDLSIFGDGAAAVLIEKGGTGTIGEFELGTDGRGKENLILRGGGMRQKCDGMTGDGEESVKTPQDDYLFMNGPEIFNFTIEVLPGLVKRTLEKNGVAPEEVDCFLFHQANAYILNFIRKITKIPPEKFPVDLKDTGNTVSASIPILLEKLVKDGRVQRGSKLMLAGFGVGYSYGGIILQY